MAISNEDLEIKAAWLYYVHGLGQESVANRLHISRSKVARILSAARDNGFVKILVEHKTTETLALADWISHQFNIHECLMTPYLDTRSTDSAINERLGRQGVGIVAANHVGRRLQNAVSMTVGIGAGKTLAEMIVSLPAMAKDDLRIASLLGASTFDDGNSCYSLTLRLAAVTGGRAHTLPVPLSVADPSTRRALESDRSVLRTLEIARAADVKILGCSDCLEGNTFFRSMQLERADIDELAASGAVCEIAGIFLDASGALAPTRLNTRSMGVGGEALKGSETIILAAGRRKARPLKALMRAGLAHTIIIDTELAEALVEGGVG